jgi:hypothetical protein
MSGRTPCSQTLTYDTQATTRKQATAGMLATAKINATTGTPALSKGHQQEKAQPQQQKRQQQQDLYGKAIKVAENKAINMTVNVAVIKKMSGRERSPSGRGFLLGLAVKAYRDLLATLQQQKSESTI